MTDRIQRESTLPCDIETAWRAVTDPAWLREWLADEVVFELTPGGEAAFLIDGAARSGWVEEVQPPSVTADDEDASARLCFWWQGDDEPASRVALELTGDGERTRLRVLETRPLELLDLVGMPLPGLGGSSYGPALVAA